MSPKTLLTFCTHGVLLRTIYADPTLLNSTTHIIVDEIDEEDIFTCFLTPSPAHTPVPQREVQRLISRDPTSHTCNLLLGVLHRILPQYSHLKLILLVNLKSTSAVIMRSPCLSRPNSDQAEHTSLRNKEWPTLDEVSEKWFQFLA